MADMPDKWGELVAQRGFAQVPNYLIQLNQFLDEEHALSAAELMVLIQLVAAWWKRDELPFPSVGTLAKRSGVSVRQVQRALTKLEESNLVIREKRRTRGTIQSNAYNLTPLVEYLNGIAKQFPNIYVRRTAPIESAAATVSTSTKLRLRGRALPTPK